MIIFQTPIIDIKRGQGMHYCWGINSIGTQPVMIKQHYRNPFVPGDLLDECRLDLIYF